MSTDVSRPVRQHQIAVPGGAVHIDEHVGSAPAVVMTHGFPDDSRIYRRLVPELGGARVVTFDFLGYGRSERTANRALEPGQREAELGRVLAELELDDVVLVGHDSGGPVVVNHTLAQPSGIRSLVLLNTYYGSAPTLQFPELIRLLADPDFAPLADAMLADPAQRRWVLDHTGRRFDQDPSDPEGVAPLAIAPQFFGSEDQPDARAAIRAWTAELFADLAIQDHRIATGRLAHLAVPVTLAFGRRDPYLNTGVAEHLGGLFAHARVQHVEDASHWPQWDQPRAIAALIEAARQHA